MLTDRFSKLQYKFSLTGVSLDTCSIYKFTSVRMLVICTRQIFSNSVQKSNLVKFEKCLTLAISTHNECKAVSHFFSVIFSASINQWDICSNLFIGIYFSGKLTACMKILFLKRVKLVSACYAYHKNNNIAFFPFTI